MQTMRILDCNLSYGRPIDRPRCAVCADFDALRAALDSADVDGGLIFSLSTDVVSVMEGNRRASADAVSGGERFRCVWTLTPSVTGETPAPETLREMLAVQQIGAITFRPQIGRFPATATYVGDYLEMAQRCKIPVVLNVETGITAEQIDHLLSDFPALTVILGDHVELWSISRRFYPLLERYPNVCLDTSSMFNDQGVEEAVRLFGSKRLIFGSGFPLRYISAGIAYIGTADISDEDKARIFGENLIGLFEGMVGA